MFAKSSQGILELSFICSKETQLHLKNPVTPSEICSREMKVA